MKKNTLQEHSRNYSTHVRPYEDFKKAEDRKKAVLSFLKSTVRSKIVLDLGCGEGTDAKVLAPISKYYYALDSSEEQLERARRQCRGMKKIRFLHSSGEAIALPKESVDIVIFSWVLSVINGYRRKSRVLAEAARVLRPNGKMIAVENDWRGEFDRIRRHPKKTAKFNRWLVKKGFNLSKKISTYFEFPSREIAERTFDEIWGKRVANRVRSRKIGHKIVIFTK